MITIRRCLIYAVLCLPLVVSLAAADSWTVYPTTATNCTGYTDYATKHDGPILIYGGATEGTVRKGNGYLKFDVSAIPDGTTVTAIQWNYYISSANWPFWSVTPLDADPVALAGTPQLVWEDLEAERDAGYYNFLNESSGYDPGWKQLLLGGTANADLSALLASGQDWFAFGGVSRNSSSTYDQVIHGHTDPSVPYLVVYEIPPPPNDTCAGAFVVSGTPGSYTYTGDTLFATGDYDCSAPCVGGLSHGGNDVTYAITLPAGCEVCVTLNQNEMTWNGGVYMVTDCYDVNGTCVAGASGWLAGGEDEVFCYSATSSDTYYIIVDSRTSGGAGPFQLDVDVSCLAAPSDLLCNDTGSQVELSWINNDSYAAIEIYLNGDIHATLAGSATSAIVVPLVPGYLCFQVCGVAGIESSCSDDCCLIFGYNNVEVLWDFDDDDGGFMVQGTGAWEWGAPTYGACFDTAAGNVWATDLDADYVNDACWLLDSSLITLGEQGGFICFDQCYDIENGWDGGVVWFTTDDFWYYNFEPLNGTDVTITGNAGCGWVAGREGFTGTSGGWVTDCWDFTDPMWSNEPVKIRFAFGSDSSVTAPGWMIDNITIFNNFSKPFECDYTVVPISGTVPFQTIHRVTLSNNLTGGAVYTRRFSAQIAVTIGNGNYFNPWRAGYTNVAPSSTYTTQFPVNLPALASVIGSNIFALSAEDVTPAPYNQPPYPPSGSTCTKTNVVVASVP